LRQRLSSEKATPAVAFCFALNHLLDAEPWARERLAPFAGEGVEVQAAPLPPLRLTILPGGRVEAGGGEPALVVTLRPEALAGLARGGEHFMRSVDVAGNARLAGEVMALVRHLRWDVEEDLSKLIGDVAARRLVQAGRDLAAWQADALLRLAEAFAGYAADESRVLVRRAELEGLGQSVAQLRDALERLEKRIERLG
jgi:ubiquinone biosynthesis protein UbiJ